MHEFIKALQLYPELIASQACFIRLIIRISIKFTLCDHKLLSYMTNFNVHLVAVVFRYTAASNFKIEDLICQKK